MDTDKENKLGGQINVNGTESDSGLWVRLLWNNRQTNLRIVRQTGKLAGGWRLAGWMYVLRMGGWMDPEHWEGLEMWKNMGLAVKFCEKTPLHRTRSTRYSTPYSLAIDHQLISLP